MRIKEFLSVRGIEFTSINIVADADGLAEMRRLGARSLPVVSRGDRFVFAQSLGDVIAFLKLDEDASPELSPAELVERLNITLDGALRYVRQMPESALQRELPNRPRSYRVLMHHVFQIPNAFLDAAEGAKFTSENLLALPPEHLETGADIAAFGEEVRRRVRRWWDRLDDKSGTQVMDTYYGQKPMHEVLERTTWHSAQHARQLMSLLEQLGVTPEGPLTKKDLQGLPLTEKIWD